MNSKNLGVAGEELIAKRLQKDGYTILARNYIKKGGEIDIIAQKDDTLAFVEVKTRRNPLFDISQSIVPSKQRKITIVAKQFLAEHTNIDLYCRFDVALVEYRDDDPVITYIPNAFTCE